MKYTCFLLYVLIGGDMCAMVRMPQFACGCERAPGGTLSVPSTVWAPVIKLRWPDLVASVLHLLSLLESLVDIL